MVRSMLAEKKIPKLFWPEAVNWTMHVLNRSPTFAVKNKTPEEAWSGYKPSVDHFRIFGCISHVHVPDSRRIKLDDKSLKCIFFGVSEESKAYRLFDPVSQKVIVSRDVVFNENQSWNWDESHEEAILADLEWKPEEEEGTEKRNSEDESTVSVVEETLGDEGVIEGDVVDNVPSTMLASGSPPREARIKRPPGWMRDYVGGEGLSEEDDVDVNLAHLALFIDADPISYEEAAKSKIWRQAMDAEIQAIERNDTWKLTELPPRGKTIGVKWVFRTKLNENGEVDKYKARLVAKGYSQQYGVDYADVFAPVARLDTIRVVLSLAAQKTWMVYQLDVKSAFLHGELNEEQGHEQKVYMLKKALYGLKQAPRTWYSRIESYFIREGFRKCPYEHTLFTKTKNEGMLIVRLYVDDLIFIGNDESMFKEFKQSMMIEFDMIDLGKMSYFLGIEVLQKTDGIFISQRKYAQEVLKRFNMDQCNPVVPGFKLMKDEDGVRIDSTLYEQMVGSLMYLTATHLDLMFIATKRVLRYLKGTLSFGVFYKKGGKGELVGYTDSDYAGDQDDRRSTSGYMFMMGSGVISWSSRKQPVVSLSTTEAEFIFAALSACQAVWMRRILQELKHVQHKATVLYCDNVSAIKISRNPVMHGRSKHIDIRFHFLHDLIKEEVVDLVQCSSQEQVADILTKPLKLDLFTRLRGQMGVISYPAVN
ncbi:unnamed protein product [Prunus armeniaca]